MDPVRQLIVDKAKESRRSLRSLSLKIGRNETWVQQFIQKQSPRILPERERRALAELLSIDESLLRHEVGPVGERVPRIEPPLPAHNARVTGPVHMTTLVPAYGHAAGGRDGQFPFNGNRVADLPAPPSLAGIRDAYAVYVAGTSMVPRYAPGEVAFVHPYLPVRAGDFVVAQIAGNEGEPPDAYVKQYISRDERFLKLRQLNPRRDLKFPARRIVSVHRIIMAGEG